jgi:glycosyltransferase involved in cell wall biosynthesis
MQRSRLLIAVTSPKSAVFFTGQLAKLREAGFDVHFLCSPGPEAEAMASDQQAAFHPVPLSRAISPWRDLKALLQVMGILRRLAPTVVNTGTPKAGLVVMLAAWCCRVPIRIYTVHGLRFETVRGPLRSLLVTIERIVCTMATEVLCVSASLRDDVIGHRLATAAKVRLLGKGSVNGIDVAGSGRMAWDQAGRAMRAGHGIPPEAVVIGFVGRLVRDKGLHELAQAWRSLRQAHADAHLLIVGGGEEEDPMAYDDEAALRADVRVHFTGHLREVRPAYAAMDVLALPSYREGLGLALLEAGAMEIPAVASDISGCRDAVMDGVTGMLVPARNAEALAHALGAYLDDAGLRARHGAAAARFVAENFARDQVWQGLAGYYQDLLAKNRPASRG